MVGTEFIIVGVVEKTRLDDRSLVMMSDDDTDDLHLWEQALLRDVVEEKRPETPPTELALPRPPAAPARPRRVRMRRATVTTAPPPPPRPDLWSDLLILGTGPTGIMAAATVAPTDSDARASGDISPTLLDRDRRMRQMWGSMFDLVDRILLRDLETDIMDAIAHESLQTYECKAIQRDENRELHDSVVVRAHDPQRDRLERCFICYEHWKPGDEVTELRCKHVFHTPCIREAIFYQPKCPICRTLQPIATPAAQAVGKTDR